MTPDFNSSILGALDPSKLLGRLGSINAPQRSGPTSAEMQTTMDYGKALLGADVAKNPLHWTQVVGPMLQRFAGGGQLNRAYNKQDMMRSREIPAFQTTTNPAGPTTIPQPNAQPQMQPRPQQYQTYQPSDMPTNFWMPRNITN